MKKWYWFWIKIGGTIGFEHYRLIDGGATKSMVREMCEDWVQDSVYGRYDVYEYDFEKVEHPTKKWLESEILGNERQIKHRTKQNEKYKNLLNTYQLGDKIKKLKNNINDEVV